MDTLLFQGDRPDPDGALRPGECFVRIAVERGVDRGAGLTYRGSGVAIGDRVEVPLGRGDQRASGYVLEVGGRELLEGFDPRRVKPIARRTGSALPPELIELARWMSRYYVCPIGMVLSSMLPAAVKAQTGARTVALVDRARVEGFAPESATPSVRAAYEGLRRLGPEVFPIDPKELARRVGASNVGPVNRLVDAGVLTRVEREIVRAPDLFDFAGGAADDTRAAPLTPEQQSAVEGIGATLGSFAVHLLYGVTGSGKTEVYLRLIERVLGSGRTALVLVPEIALTPQTAARFLARFRDRGVAVLHSGLSAASRHKQWAAAAAGRARVVVGARSAVFAPLPDLGLIVVDEEHDTSYKQDQLPRYHARDVAVVRARIEAIPCVLGSATPSLESWANAQAGEAPAKYHLWTLRERVAGGRLPRVDIVDLARERRQRRAEGGVARIEALGPTLERAIERTIGAGGQVMLLLNRRGYASYLACPSARCGWVMGCEQCDASMVVHRLDAARRRGYLRCHHCQAEQAVPAACPVCAKKLIELGVGTQRLEDELETLFGTTLGLINGETMLRLDSDTMSSARDYFEALSRFGRGEIKLLLGTQMIAKGLDYPNVRLVGIVNADTAIHMPDFRAQERTFQLVSQVAGRAGRREHPGLVIVQTLYPDAPAIRLAGLHDYVGFAAEELRMRAAQRLPPAWRMVRIVARDPDPDKAAATARTLADHLADAATGRMIIDGPAPCPLARVSNQYRWEVGLSAPTPGELQQAMARLRGAGLLKSDAATAVDVDPVSLL